LKPFQPRLEELERRELLSVEPTVGIYAGGIGNKATPQTVLNDPQVTGIALRATWNFMEPTENAYNWSYLDGQIAAAANAGKKVTLSVRTGVSTPSWVYAAGAQAFTFIDSSSPATQKMPVPWDSVYLSKWETFIRQLGAHYASNPDVVQVKITGVNLDTAETRLPLSTGVKVSNGSTTWTTTNDVAHWVADGYTRTKVENAWQAIANTWSAAFPNQQIAADLDPNQFPPIDNQGNVFVDQQGADNQIVTDIINRGINSFGAQFAAQNDGLSTFWIYPTVANVADQITTGYQTIWSATGDPTYRLNGGTPIGVVPELQRAINKALAAHAQYLELYIADLENPALHDVILNTAMALTGVTLIGPSGSTTNPTPTFSWTSATGADHYDIWVNDVTTGQGQVLRNQDVTGTSWTSPISLVQGDSYRWWVQAFNNGVASPWSAPMDFSVAALATPVPSGPTGPSSDALPTFTWSAVDQADHYDVWVNDLTTKKGQVLRNTDVVGTSWTSSTPLAQGDTYEWWVQAVSSSGATSLWTPGQKFAVVPLATPVPAGPSGSNNPTTPTFSWSAVAQADHYDVWVNDVTTGQGQVLRNTDVVGTSWTPSTSLAQGDTYLWWVEAIASSNLGTTSNWSAAQQFAIPPLATPAATGPTGSITTLLPTFSWSAVAGADHYDVWVNDLTTGQGGALSNSSVIGTSWTPSTPLVQNHTYEWWVRAVSSNGGVSAWSTGQTFVVVPLATPILIGPSGSTTGSTPTFSWNAVAQADHYIIWVNDVTTGQGKVFYDPSVTSTSWTPPSNLTQGDTYTWWVQAVSADGNTSLWSSGMTFTST
jgi:hypothetical protein